MNQQTAKLVIRQRFADYLVPAKKHGQFICPLCSHGKNGDGLSVVPEHKGGDGCRLHCFGCGFHGDLIDLYSQEHGLSWRDAFRGLCREFSLSVEFPGVSLKVSARPQAGRFPGQISTLDLDRSGQSPPAMGTKDKHPGSYPPDYNSLLLPEAVAYLRSRGISVKTARSYGLEFDPAWVSPTALANLRDQGKNWSPPPSPRILIPTSEGGYTARATDPNTQPRFRKMKEGSAGLFNPGALWNPGRRPVFVVEGEFDALSVLEVGGLAVALGSVSNAGKLLALVGQKPPSGTLILSLDNDETGRKASLSLSEALQGMSVSCVISDVSVGCKDPSEALQTKRETFADSIRSAEHLASAQPDSVAFYLSRLMKGELTLFREGAYRRTGFDCLDDEAGGIYPGLYVLGAISSLGKTTILHQIADQMAAMGEHVLYFSLEQSRLELVTKSIARNAAQRAGKGAFSSLDIRTGRIPEWALTSLREAFVAYRDDVLDKLSIVEGNLDCSADHVRDYVSRYMSQNHVKPVVVVDYLQILRPPADFRGNDKQTMDYNVTALKRLSRDFDLPVFAVSSVNRANYLTPIDFESFKESGGIEYTADVVWGLQLAVLEQAVFGKDGHLKEKREAIREAKAADPRLVDLVCLKNRYGISSYKVRFEYFPKWDWFREAVLPGSGWGDEGQRF